jgi:hypothetical protein
MRSAWVLSGFVGLLLLGGVGESLLVGRESGKREDDPSGQTQKPAAAPDPNDPEDFRWLLNRAKDRDGLESVYKAMLEKLEKSKVPTAEKAKAVALEYRLKSGGLDAREGEDVVGLLRIGITVPEFADNGDLIWVVRYSMLGWGVTQEMWISSTTGAIRTMLPVQKQPK